MQRFLFYLKKYFREVIISFLVIACCGLIYYNFLDKENLETNINENIELALKEEDNTKIVKSIYVDVKGSVKKPGVYELDSDSIVNDVIKLAGGFKTNAYVNNINLSKKVSDEMVIFVYSKTEYKNKVKDNKEINTVCKCPDYNIDSCMENKTSIIENGVNNANGQDIKDDKTETNEFKTININTASISDLTSLNGIGEAKAQIIIDYRIKNGNFKDINDIKNVSGIGESLFEKIKDYITV